MSQQQGVVLARALVKNPSLILLDEPLSNIDQMFRAELRGELGNIFKVVGVTALWVTHDLEEALSVSDRIVFLGKGGRVDFIGEPDSLITSPPTHYSAKILGFNVVRIREEEISFRPRWAELDGGGRHEG